MRDLLTARRVSWKRRYPVALASLVSLTLIAGCAKSGQTQTISIADPPVAPAPPSSGGPSLARSVARSLLDNLELPSEARRVSGLPRSTALRFAGTRPATPNLVVLERTYRVPGAPRSIIDRISRSHPAGLHRTGGGSAGHHAPGQPEVEYSWFVTFEARPPARVQSETLTLATIAAPGGGTLLRAEAEVVWASERPGAERVPPGVSSIEVTRRSVDRQITLRRMISAASSVRAIIAAVERLPIVQPGTTACPDEPVGPVLTITIRGPAHEALAQAVQRTGSELGNCNPMHFSVRGSEEDPLAQGVSVVSAIGRIVGVQLLPGQGR